MTISGSSGEQASIAASAGREEARLYRFVGCTLDPAARELHRDGAPVALQPKVLELLIYLIEQRERAVGKQELQDTVWAGVIVEEASLTQAIRKARRAVGDDASSQSVIRTVHGHGYRFVAPLESTAPVTPPAAGAAKQVPADLVAAVPGLPAPPRPWRSRIGLMSLLGAVLALGLVLTWLLRTSPLHDSDVRLAVLPVANLTGKTDLDWARYGLMSMAGSLAGAAGVAVVSDADVMTFSQAQVDSAERDSQQARDLLRKAYGASHTLYMRLEYNAGLMRLVSRLSDATHEVRSSSFVGDDPVQLLRSAMNDVLEPIRDKSQTATDRPVISDDSFVNEAYARGRALSLEGRCSDALTILQTAAQQAPELFEPRFEAAVCRQVMGDVKGAESAFRELLGQSGRTQRQQARLHKELGVIDNITGRQEESMQEYRQAMKLATDIDDAELKAQALVSMAITEHDRSQYEEARTLLGRAITEYRAAGRELIPGHVYSTLANIAMEQGQLTQADEQLPRALGSFRTLGDRRREAMMLNNMGFLRRLQRRYDEAEVYHLESLHLREAIGDKAGIGSARNLLAVLYLEQGRLDEAMTEATAARASAIETGNRMFEATANVHIADVHLDLGALDQAAAFYDRACTIFREIDDRSRVLECDLRMARLDMKKQHADSANARARAVASSARSQSFVQVESEALIVLGDLAAEQGQRKQASSAYRQALALAQEGSLDRQRDDARIRLATIMVEDSDFAAAEPLLGLLVDAQTTPELLKLRARYASGRGDTAAAKQLIREARVLARQRWDEKDEALFTALND